jgi:hypothetical protein
MSQDKPQSNPFAGQQPEVTADIVKQMSQVRRLTRDEMLQSLSPNMLAQMVDRIGKNMWVVLDSTGRTVAYDPALRQPFHHNNKKFAETVAKEIGGVAVTWADALRVISERNKSS